MKKVIVIGILLLVIAGGSGIYLLLSNLNSLVASAIEKHGSEVTETRVGVSGVEISLRDGSGSIHDLRIASAEGFKTRDVFTLGNITIDLDVGSVREDPIVIEEIRIAAPEINAELRKDGTSNVDELRKRVQAYRAAESGEESGPQKNLRIRRFILEKGRVSVDLSALGKETHTLTLPEIRLNDVGGEKGIPPDQVAKVILTTVAKKTTSEIARSEVKNLIEGELKETLSDKAKGLLDKIKQ